MIKLISGSECGLAVEYFFVVGLHARTGPSDLVDLFLVLQELELFE